MSEISETQLLRREYQAELQRGDGRSVDVRIVPYGETITHNDGLGGVPAGVEYREQWMPGVFDHQLEAAHRVVGNFEHQRGIAGIVARAVELRESADGFHGTFRMLSGSDADKALELIDTGVLDGVSLEAMPVKSQKTKSGVVQRVRANLFGVAFTRFAAYAGARVLAVRDQHIVDEIESFPEMDPELVAACRELGIKLPDRYAEAHPADGHPAETGGTPADDTRPEESTTLMEEAEWVQRSRSCV